MRMNIPIGLILTAMIIPTFSVAADKKTKKENDNPTVVVIKDGVKTTIPFSLSQTEFVKPDSIENVSVNNDTIFIKHKSVRKHAGKSSTVKK